MSYEDEISGLRKEIDRLNVEIIEKMKERRDAAVKIGAIKKRYGKPIVDPAREQLIYNRVREIAEQRSLDPEAVERVFREIIRLCVNAEEKHT